MPDDAAQEAVARAIYETHQSEVAPVWDNASRAVQEWVLTQAASAISAYEAAAIEKPNQSDPRIEQLDQNVKGWREMRHCNGRPVYSETGTLLDENGNRSIFDDVDE